MEDLVEPLLELLRLLAKAPRALREARLRHARAADASKPFGSALDMALANSRRSGMWQVPRGGMLRSGDLEIKIEQRLRISRRDQLVHQVDIGTGHRLILEPPPDTSCASTSPDYREWHD